LRCGGCGYIVRAIIWPSVNIIIYGVVGAAAAQDELVG
jgi:hypothetical protein